MQPLPNYFELFLLHCCTFDANKDYYYADNDGNMRNTDDNTAY